MKRLIFAFALLMFSTSVRADNMELIKTFSHVPKLNREVKMSKEEFEAKTRQIDEVPLANNTLAFKIRLGKDWTKLDTDGNNQSNNISKQILGNISIYLGPPNLDLRSSFRLRANDLPFDVSAKDWFLNYMLINNYNLQGLEITSGKRVQAQYVMVENGAQSVVRAVAEISGSRIILAEYIVPIEFWAKEADIAKRSMASFYLVNPDASEVEPLGSFSFVDIAKFSYPKSWILIAPPITSIENMSASLTNLKGGIPFKNRFKMVETNPLMDGRIDISVITKGPDTTLQKEVLKLKTQMQSRGLVLGDLMESVEGWQYNSAITFGRIEVYKLNNAASRLADYENWIGVFETPGRIYIVRLLTVGRNDNYLTWARNVQAYRLAISSLSPVSKDE